MFAKIVSEKHELVAFRRKNPRPGERNISGMLNPENWNNPQGRFSLSLKSGVNRVYHIEDVAEITPLTVRLDGIESGAYVPRKTRTNTLRDKPPNSSVLASRLHHKVNSSPNELQVWARRVIPNRER